MKSERFRHAAEARASRNAGDVIRSNADRPGYKDPRLGHADAAYHYDNASRHYEAANQHDKAYQTARDAYGENARSGEDPRPGEMERIKQLQGKTWAAKWQAARGKVTPGSPAAEHAAAAEHHIESAHAHEVAGNQAKADFHQAMAAGHAATAARYGAWNEDDHPRDENGRFA